MAVISTESTLETLWCLTSIVSVHVPRPTSALGLWIVIDPPAVCVSDGGTYADNVMATETYKQAGMHYHMLIIITLIFLSVITG